MYRKSENLELSEISFGEKNKEYVIYGTGEIGRMLKRTLQLLGNTVVMFLCSDGYKKEEYIDDVKVEEFSEFCNTQKYEILLTVQRDANHIYKTIKQKVCNKVINVNSFNDVLSVYSFFYKNYFETVGINIDNDIININNKKFLNPFNSDKTYALSFFMECGDLILPALFNDLSCIHEGPYERNNIIIENDDIVIDCGSNMGLFSIVIADRCNRVYAFEPVKETQKYIKQVLNIYNNINLCDYALSDEVGTANFSTDADTNFSNHIVKDESNKNSIIVNVTTIDRFVEENNISRIDFIKADIEGTERDMLKGATNTLKKFGPKLAICEYHLADDPEVLERIILEANPNYIVEHHDMKLYAYIPK